MPLTPLRKAVLYVNTLQALPRSKEVISTQGKLSTANVYIPGTSAKAGYGVTSFHIPSEQNYAAFRSLNTDLNFLTLIQWQGHHM